MAKVKPKLATQKETFIVVDYADLQVFAEEVYFGFDGIPDLEREPHFNFTADQGDCENDTVHLFQVEKGTLSLEEVNQLAEFKAGKPTSRLADTLLNDLCNQGRIKSGVYLVKVSW